jgi:hypothetical protein
MDEQLDVTATEEKEINESKAIGGHARAKALSSEKRKEIARKAAEARWGANVPQATHEGEFKIGSVVISAAVLPPPDRKRLLSQGSFLLALGRSRTPKAGTGALSSVDGLPFFLQAEQLKPFISEELRVSTAPIFFRNSKGQRSVGYDALLLPMVCEVYLRFRDHCLEQTSKIPTNYRHIIRACDSLMRGLAQVGIIALVDEATGYQNDRDREALQAILDKFLRKDLAVWAKRFPDEFYQHIFRLRGWEWKGMKVNRPQIVAHYTKDLIYERLAPGVLKELEAKNPKDEKGRRKAKHHQWLTEDIGHPALAQQLYAAMGFQRIATTWDQFYAMMNKAFPRMGNTLELPFPNV